MKLEAFIEGYDKSKDKDQYFKKHLVNKYINFADKDADCARIAQSCWINHDGEGSEYRIDSATIKFLFELMLFKNYTDIEIEDSNPLNYYDEMCKRGLINKLIDRIGEEYLRFNEMLQMKIEDIKINERSFSGYLDKKTIEILEILKGIDLGKLNGGE